MVNGIDSRMPSENQLDEQFECSRMMTSHALTEKVDNGVLERTQGFRTFVTELKF